VVHWAFQEKQRNFYATDVTAPLEMKMSRVPVPFWKGWPRLTASPSPGRRNSRPRRAQMPSLAMATGTVGWHADCYPMIGSWLSHLRGFACPCYPAGGGEMASYERR
jgi:hypothetical protein